MVFLTAFVLYDLISFEMGLIRDRHYTFWYYTLTYYAAFYNDYLCYTINVDYIPINLVYDNLYTYRYAMEIVFYR